MLCQFHVYSKVIHLHIYIYPLFFLKMPFLYRTLQSFEQSSLCYMAGSYKLSILYIVMYICQLQSPSLPLPSLSSGNCKFVFYICDSISVLQINSSVFLFKDSTLKQYHMMFVFLSDFTRYDNLQVYPCCCIWNHFVLFYG